MGVLFQPSLPFHDRIRSAGAPAGWAARGCQRGMVVKAAGCAGQGILILAQDLPASVFSTRARGRLEPARARAMCLRASDPAGHHGLDIMNGVDGGCAVGGGPGFVGIPPYLARQAQVPFPGEFIPPALSPRLPDVGQNLRRKALSGLQNGRRGPSRRLSGEGGPGIAEKPGKSPI